MVNEDFEVGRGRQYVYNLYDSSLVSFFCVATHSDAFLVKSSMK